MQGRADGKHSDVIQQAEGERGWKPHVIILETRTPYSLISSFFQLRGVPARETQRCTLDLLILRSGPPRGALQLFCGARFKRIDPVFLWRVTGPTCGMMQGTIVWKRLWRQLKFIVRLVNPYGAEAFEIASGRRDDFNGFTDTCANLCGWRMFRCFLWLRDFMLRGF